MTEKAENSILRGNLTYDAEKEALRHALRVILEACKPTFGSFPARLDQIRTIAAEALDE